MSGAGLVVGDLALVLAVLLMMAWFVAWPPLGRGVAFAGAVAWVAGRVRGAGRGLMDWARAIGMLMSMQNGSDGNHENGGGKGFKFFVRNYWNTRYAWWLNESARASKMSAKLEFCALSGLLFWLLFSLLTDLMIYAMIHVLASDVWISTPWHLIVDYVIGVMVWVLYVVSRFNLSRFDDASLWRGLVFCGLLSLVVSYFSMDFMRGHMPIEIIVTFAPAFLFWMFILWTVWAGLFGRYVKCMFRRNSMMMDFMDEMGASGWGMPLGDRKSKTKGGIIGNIVDWAVRLIALVALAIMFLGMYLIYTLISSPDGSENFVNFIDNIVKFYIWLTE